MNEFFFAALSFGLAAGLKPGPLGIIVIQQTLSKGLAAGIRASLAPLITDGPIIIAALWLLTEFKSIDLFAAALGLLGGMYLVWLAVKILRVREISLAGKLDSRNSLFTAVKINLLNPGPYLFWFTVGGSYIVARKYCFRRHRYRHANRRQDSRRSACCTILFLARESGLSARYEAACRHSDLVWYHVDRKGCPSRFSVRRLLLTIRLAGQGP
jgi:hypothetical protein